MGLHIAKSVQALAQAGALVVAGATADLEAADLSSTNLTARPPVPVVVTSAPHFSTPAAPIYRTEADLSPGERKAYARLLAEVDRTAKAEEKTARRDAEKTGRVTGDVLGIGAAIATGHRPHPEQLAKDAGKKHTTAINESRAYTAHERALRALDQFEIAHGMRETSFK